MTDCILKITHLQKSFGVLKASDDLSLDLRAGEIHAVIGPNGAGKSTLIKQICGELAPDSGSIEFLGQDVTSLDVASRARLGLGRTFQVSSLAMEYSALRNVMLAVQSVQGSSFRFFKSLAADQPLRDTAMDCLVEVGLELRADVCAAQLSHGERRQLEIAVVLALQPKAFLLDEPMAGMGAEGSKKLTDFLDKLRQRAPILMVEHDMDAVFSLADRISVLVYGKIIMTGTVDQVRSDARVREAYLGEE
ncbi:MAG: ABC transporter ATP-binding protein [Pseudomonadales bacterium]|nr:ABC transporter ATP-binding protein [Pseudomonadales bacterium]NRA16270.1 ABC transporter ATP-binding protein [Oceanospirillaceae bacterium]